MIWSRVTRTFDLVSAAVGVARELGCDCVKLWPGQDGHDYPFQVDHGQVWSYAVTGLRALAQAHPDMKFAIEYKPREPRVSMFFASAAKTLLAIEDMDVPNVGILLDFGHSLYGGESPAEAARLIHSRGLLYGIDVNDNFRGWDDDLVVGSVHLVETLEFSTRSASAAGRASGSSTSSPSGRTPSRPPERGSKRCGASTARWICSTSRPCAKPRTARMHWPQTGSRARRS
jgi:L-rhamnose isomerase